MAKNLSSNARTAINIISSFSATIFGLLISFFLSPYIVRTIGVEANGFVALAGNFTTYATLVVMALNNMAGRFITIAYVQKDFKQANLYYNSVFWGNLIIVAILLIPSILLICNLEQFIAIPAHLVADVKILFALVFLGFFIGTSAPKWDCSTAITNRMDRSCIPNMITSLLRCLLILGLYWSFTPRVWYSSLAGLIISFLSLGIAAYNARTLTPELRVQLRKPICSAHAIRELVGSGIWSSIANAGNMLYSGLDLVICNVVLGPVTMGVLSLTKTLPSILLNFAEPLRGVLSPEMTILYAKGDRKELIRIIHRDVKLSMVIVSVLAGGIMVMSDAFYQLWLPSEDAKLLQLLTTLAILRYITDSGSTILESVFPTTNTVRYNAVSLLISGGVSIAATLLLISFTDWDLYAIAGTSSIVAILRSMVFLLPASAHFLEQKWYIFYPQVLQSVLSCGVIVGIGWLVRMMLPIHSWITFFLACGITGILGLCANMMIVLNKEERSYLIGMVMRRFLKKS